MAGGGYPVAYRSQRSAPAPIKDGVALKAPLPGVQHKGPSPFLDYPMRDWDKIQRRRSGGVPSIGRAPSKKVYALPIARAAFRLVNRWQDLIEVGSYIEQELFLDKAPRYAIVLNGAWSLCRNYANCADDPTVQLHHTTAGCPTTTNTGCLSGQAFQATHPLGTVPDANIHQIVYARITGTTVKRATHIRVVWRPQGTSPSPVPAIVSPYPRVVTAPNPRTWVETAFPDMVPPGSPQATPQPVPYRIRPHRKNTDKAQERKAGYQVPGHGRSTNPGLDAVPGQTTSPRPGTRPGVTPRPGVTDPVTSPTPGTTPGVGTPPVTRPAEPGTEVVTDVTHGRTNTYTRPSTHRAGRPGKRKSETKLVLQAKGGISAVMNVVTEGADFVNAIHKALPRKYQAPRVQQTDPRTGRKYTSQPNILDKAAHVVRHRAHMDWGKAVGEVIKNQAEDRFFGQLGKMMGKANRAAYKKTGLRTQHTLGPGI